ncbi:ribonuclease J [Limibacillus sp. MBR-115]|uniref:ribonuclease J n=1 Tax=Limibacillus sp. MBR-115 TaxID=3156465 RepID=UPI0033983D63
MADFPEKEALYFLPLGGTGEIGMNLNLYGHDGAWLMVDLGVTFGDERVPGVDLVMPDPAFIEARRKDLVGLILTHAHEDHLGAVPYLWDRLGCPVYATAFTASLLRRKLEEVGLLGKVPIHEVDLSGSFSVGPFEIELVTLTHSIPEPNALIIKTPMGTVLHTGDWKLDPEPLLGDNFDEARLRRLADEDVLAMVCDSTNALVEGESGSESGVQQGLLRLISGLDQRVAVGCFASNVARLHSLGQVARKTGRRVALVGRSLHRMVEAAQETGYLLDFPNTVDEREVGYLPRSEVMLICTGSQGEARSALARIARKEHAHVKLEAGDAVVFSSRIIPGNEVSIFSLQNLLALDGVEVYTDDDHPIHVSGHPAREELTQMYHWVRPRIAIPVHGEPRMLQEHAQLARECQVPESIISANGDLIRLAPGPAEIVSQVPSGRLALDGQKVRPIDSEVLRSRVRMLHNGSAGVTLVIDEDGELLADPVISCHGLLDEEEQEANMEDVADYIERQIASLRKSERRDDAIVTETARVALRRSFKRLTGRKPVTQVHVIRLE